LIINGKAENYGISKCTVFIEPPCIILFHTVARPLLLLAVDIRILPVTYPKHGTDGTCSSQISDTGNGLLCVALLCGICLTVTSIVVLAVASLLRPL